MNPLTGKAAMKNFRLTLDSQIIKTHNATAETYQALGLPLMRLTKTPRPIPKINSNDLLTRAPLAFSSCLVSDALGLSSLGSSFGARGIDDCAACSAADLAARSLSL